LEAGTAGLDAVVESVVYWTLFVVRFVFYVLVVSLVEDWYWHFAIDWVDCDGAVVSQLDVVHEEWLAVVAVALYDVVRLAMGSESLWRLAD